MEYLSQWCKSLLSIGEDKLQFYPNFAQFSTLGDEPRPRFFQVSKLREDQKKGLYQKWNTFFPRIQVMTKKRSSPKMEHILPRIQVKTKKKGLHPQMEHFFPRIQVLTCAQMHTRVKLLEGMQMKTILELLGVYSQIIGGIVYPPPSPPGFGTSELSFGRAYFHSGCVTCVGVARIFNWGGPNHKLHAMTSSESSKEEFFGGANIS